MVAGEAHRAAADFLVVQSPAFGVHAACVALIANVDTLPLDALLGQAAFSV